MSRWVRPVSEPHKITSDAADHLARPGNDLCGIDYVSLADTHLRAMSEGFIEYAHTNLGDDPYNFDTLGHFIVIKHEIRGMPVWTRMCHAESLQQTRGEVSPGWPVGIYGSTGISTGPHVHVDFWAMPQDIAKLEASGFKRCQRIVHPWPTARFALQNIDPTNFLVMEFRK